MNITYILEAFFYRSWTSSNLILDIFYYLFELAKACFLSKNYTDKILAKLVFIIYAVVRNFGH